MKKSNHLDDTTLHKPADRDKKWLSYLRCDFERSNNLNTSMFAFNRDFGKLFMVKHKCV